MRILYIYAHPNEHSFNKVMQNHAISMLQNNQHEMMISDLYAQRFNPLASWEDFKLGNESMDPQYMLAQQQAYKQHALCDEIAAEIKKIAWAEHIIFQFPLWWFSTPAILKGWFDRVLVKGFAYDAGKIFDDGLLQGKTASLVVTTHSPESAYQRDGAHQATIDTFLHHIQHTLRFVGIQTLAPFVIHGVSNLDAARQQEIEQEFSKYLTSAMYK